ncbi:hypothetical protein GZL_03815 [Streptomyces sp. 769]|nr:hypothetical protein GZL_03815 [Streptomyces sp. 769]
MNSAGLHPCTACLEVRRGAASRRGRVTRRIGRRGPRH